MDKSKLYMLGFRKDEFNREWLDGKTDAQLITMQLIHHNISLRIPYERWQNDMLNCTDLQQELKLGHAIRLTRYYWYLVLER